MRDKDIFPRYTHSKLGNFAFFLCAKATKFLIRCRVIYYLLACTWGIVMTLVGLLVSATMAVWRIFDRSICFEKYHWVYCVKAGPAYWGGFDTGLMFLRDRKSADSLSSHEWGHSFQNCLLGPLMVVLVTIPSAVRWWYRKLRYERRGQVPPTCYDGFWAEDAASQCGLYAAKYLENKK